MIYKQNILKLLSKLFCEKGYNPLLQTHTNKVGAARTASSCIMGSSQPFLSSTSTFPTAYKTSSSKTPESNAKVTIFQRLLNQLPELCMIKSYNVYLRKQGGERKDPLSSIEILSELSSETSTGYTTC